MKKIRGKNIARKDVEKKKRNRGEKRKKKKEKERQGKAEDNEDLGNSMASGANLKTKNRKKKEKRSRNPREEIFFIFSVFTAVEFSRRPKELSSGNQQPREEGDAKWRCGRGENKAVDSSEWGKEGGWRFGV